MISFFFQAEDGIRDLTVTGVQTCALPISIAAGDLPVPESFTSAVTRPSMEFAQLPGRKNAIGKSLPFKVSDAAGRSEERRVGKECRSRWSPHHEKKNTIGLDRHTNVSTHP